MKLTEEVCDAVVGLSISEAKQLIYQSGLSCRIIQNSDDLDESYVSKRINLYVDEVGKVEEASIG